MGTYWGCMGSCRDILGLMGMYGDIRMGVVGTYWDILSSICIQMDVFCYLFHWTIAFAEVRNEVGQIIGDKTLLATEKYKVSPSTYLLFTYLSNDYLFICYLSIVCLLFVCYFSAVCLLLCDVGLLIFCCMSAVCLLFVFVYLLFVCCVSVDCQ